MRRELTCPHCGRVNDTHEAADAPEPVAGDIGICWKCRGLTILTPFGFLRLPRPEEVPAIEADPAVKSTKAAMAEAFTPDEALRLLGKRP